MKKKRMKGVFLLLGVLHSVNWCYGQSTVSDPPKKQNDIYVQQREIANDIAKKSTLVPITIPDARSMVSLNQSGDGMISMPVVNVRGRKLSLPVTLSYVTSGIKLNQKATDVGLGWNISFGSITRDYGAYEPDYTYNGSEFKMLSENGGITSGGIPLDGKLITQSGGTQRIIIPERHNKTLPYNNVSYGKAPDRYNINVPGLESNDFWNGDAYDPPSGSAPHDPSFVFSKKSPWKITYDKEVFSVSQEISRINEINYMNSSLGTSATGPSAILKNTPTSSNNLTAAIGLYPYVLHQQCPNYDGDAVYSADLSSLAGENVKVKYEDYSKFTITTADGTQYIFGRPLRGQKYLFSEEPYWSTMDARNPGPHDHNRTYNELWKTDYIAEWLLTEIRSNDFFDFNGNGVADDGDYGDWIAIDYTDPYQNIHVPGCPSITLQAPAHRDWNNFTQTDNTSSLWREKAYVAQIRTPVETVDFTSSTRFDIDHDYTNTPFNRINNYYVYFNSSFAGASGNTDISYPVEVMKYDRVDVRESISSTHNLVQNVKLNYAEKGSPQELAVSHTMLLDNDGNFYPYNPQVTAGNLEKADIDNTSHPGRAGRGKTTLVGIDYRGNDISSDNKISYTFNYDFNPDFDDIHWYEVQKMIYYPTIRECSKSVDLRFDNNFHVGSGGAASYYVSNSLLPYKSIGFDQDGNANFNSDNSGNDVKEDELGYYYDIHHPFDLRKSWTLTGIGLPYGGNIHITYENDQTDIATDRPFMDGDNSFSDFCIPAVGYYNTIVNVKNVMQDHTNKYWADWATWMGYVYDPHKLEPVNYEYYFLMNSNTGGLRIHQIDITDNYGAPTITKTYSYGLGHYTLPPPDYWANYIAGFSSFSSMERYKYIHLHLESEWAYHYTAGGTMPVTQPWGYSDYVHSISRLIPDIRVDNSIEKQSTHYYETISETNSDGSKTTWYYGKLNNNFTEPHPEKAYGNKLFSGILKSVALSGSDDDGHNSISHIITTNVDNSLQVGNYKTELWDNTGQLIKSTQTNYNFQTHNNLYINLTRFTFPAFDYSPQSLVGTHIGSDYVLRGELCPTMNCESGFDAANPFPLLYQFGGFSLFEIMRYSYPLGYTSSVHGTPLNISSLARNPLSKLGVNCGYYPSVTSSWFTDILSYPDPWTSSTDAATVRNGFTNYYNYWTAGHTVDAFHREWIRDFQSFSDALIYKTHESYTLHPTHTKTITNFY